MGKSEKIQFIIDHYENYSKKKLSEHLNVSVYWVRNTLKSLSDSGRIKSRSFPSDRKTSEKIQFVKNNYLKYTKKVIAEKLGESPRWVKRVVIGLIKKNELVSKVTFPEKTLIESDWTDFIKYRAFELRKRYLKTNPQICQILKEEFNFIVNPSSFQFWMKRFGCRGRTKQEWMEEYLTKELIDELLSKSYRIIDISDYIKKIYGVYISDDLISVYMRKIVLS